MSESAPSSAPTRRLRLTPKQGFHLFVVLLCTAAAIGHQTALWKWFIEDAAISFAYAKHLADGDGLVSFVGGERVEGYSNPTWTFFLAGLHWVGLDLFEAVKWVQVIQTAITVPVSYLIGREAFRDRPNNPAVLLVPAFVAANAQFAIWGSAGLENGMLNLFITLAIWRLLVEARTGSFPWSAVFWLLVSLTRPESISYAAVGGFLSMVFHLAAGRGLMPTLKWLLLFWPAFLGYHFLRYQYFAWPFPNTFYAKLDHRAAPPGGWGRRPWLWSQRWAHELGHGYLMPVYLFGILGNGRAWRYLMVAAVLLLVGGSIELSDNQRWLMPLVLGVTYIVFSVGITTGNDKPPRALVGGGLVAALLLFGLSEAVRYQFGFEPNKLPTPDGVRAWTPYLLVGSALLMPLLSVGSSGWQARITAWCMCMAAAFFAVWAEFDWMKGFRWYSTAAVPGAVLLAMGVDSMMIALAGWTQTMNVRAAKAGAYSFAVLLLAGFATLHGFHTKAIVDKPDARPQGVKSRVDFVDSVRDRLFVDDEKWMDLDVDQGAHLYWSDFDMLDIAGLIDIPMGHHKFDRGFIREYIFEEKRPHFAHVHGSWASTSKLPSHPEWKRDYVEIPGFPVGGRQFHIGNHVRKDLFLVDVSPFPADLRRVGQQGLSFDGFAFPVNPGKARAAYVEVGIGKSRRAKFGNVRLVMGVKGPGGFNSFDIPLGYDWWLPKDWTEGKVFHGRYAIPLPPSLKPGTYDVAFVVFNEDGSVMPLNDPRAQPGDGVEAPILAVGEARYDQALTIVTPEARADEAAERREKAVVLAGEGQCDEAAELWLKSRRSRPLDDKWLDQHRPRVRRALAGCWIASVDTTNDVEQQLLWLEHARFLDARHPELYPAAKRVAQPLMDAANSAFAEGNDACADVAPRAQGWLASFRATSEDYRLLGTCQKEQMPAWNKAYELYSNVLRADPSRSWARRYAEEARALRLGIDDGSMALKDLEVEARRKSVGERRKEYEARKKKAEDEPDPKEDAGEENDEGKGTDN